ncbi:TRAP transporter substrate-binding protein [Agrococcus terreus]|uniref:C4-dicarboxylate ABC transporter n=1 Tax=Agrococcus terreus TaxID=574649 RepID=A0ABQ2KDX8_9MICO|nr:TRAP transporter substrate-binding protein [Agrococcus terreus]GGN77944.1 C4-dicarboxylate ABC transporter [Agrococcus terreus]
MKITSRRATTGIAAIAIAGLALTGCSSAEGGTTEDGSIAPMALTLGHAYAVDSLQHRAAEQLAEEVSTLSDGAITIEVFPSAQLGSWEEMQEGLEIGSTNIVIESLGSLERYTDLAAIEGLPFLYEDEEHFFEVWDGEMKDEILTAVRDDSGFQLIGSLYRGGRVLNSTRPVEGPADLGGLKLRVPNQQTYIDTWQALGAAPTPMALNEVFSAMEQGAIEGQENPLDVVRFSSFYEVAPYVTETNHLYGNFHFQMWGDTFDGYAPEVQEILLQAADTVSSTYRETSISEREEHRAFLEENGVEFYPIDLAEWRQPTAGLIEQADPQVREWAETIIGLRG